MTAILYIVIFSAISFLFLFFLSKFLGKRQIAQLDFTDYVVGISIGSIAAEMATDLTESPWWHYLIAMAVYFVLDTLVSVLGRKSSWLSKFFKGKPLVVISDGKIDYEVLKKSKMSVTELIGLARDKGFFDFNDIAYGILETNGAFSVLPKGSQRPVVAEDFQNIPIEQASVAAYPIVDGEVSQYALGQLDRDEKWLFKKLGVRSKRELKGILLAVYDEKLDKFDVHYKDSRRNRNTNNRSERKSAADHAGIRSTHSRKESSEA